MSKMKEQNVYFVEVAGSTDIRRSLLESSKQLVQILKRYEILKGIRVEKVEQIAKLKKISKEINLLATRLRKEFPETKLRVKSSKHAPAPAAPVQTKDTSELQKLEGELSRIEGKLNRLG